MCDLSEHNVILEIGGGWGATAYLMFKNIPNITYVIVDIPVSIMTSAYFLHECGKKVCLPGEFSPSTDVTEEFLSGYDCLFLLPEQLGKVQRGFCSVICSSACLPELPADSIDYYFQEIRRLSPRHFYVDFTRAAEGRHVASCCDGLEDIFENLITQETPINTYDPPVYVDHETRNRYKAVDVDGFYIPNEYIEERVYRRIDA